MEFMADDPRRRLRACFDLVPEDYQRTRPVCPPQLFSDLIDRAGPEVRPGTWEDAKPLTPSASLWRPGPQRRQLGRVHGVGLSTVSQ
jgi:hypothetical protein